MLFEPSSPAIRVLTVIPIKAGIRDIQYFPNPEACTGLNPGSARAATPGHLILPKNSGSQLIHHLLGRVGALPMRSPCPHRTDIRSVQLGLCPSVSGL